MDDTDLNQPMALDPERAEIVLDALGGTVAVSRLTFTSTSTVHSWRDNGIRKPIFDHLRLAALARGKRAEWSIAMNALAAMEADPQLPFADAGARSTEEAA